MGKKRNERRDMKRKMAKSGGADKGGLMARIEAAKTGDKTKGKGKGGGGGGKNSKKQGKLKKKRKREELEGGQPNQPSQLPRHESKKKKKQKGKGGKAVAKTDPSRVATMASGGKMIYQRYHPCQCACSTYHRHRTQACLPSTAAGTVEGSTTLAKDPPSTRSTRGQSPLLLQTMSTLMMWWRQGSPLSVVFQFS